MRLNQTGTLQLVRKGKTVLHGLDRTDGVGHIEPNQTNSVPEDDVVSSAIL